MSKKRTKIKRYGNIYGSSMRSGSWSIIIAMFFGVLIFGIIGWSLYTPVHDFVMTLGTEQPSQPSSSVPSVSSLPGTAEQIEQDPSVAVPTDDSQSAVAVTPDVTDQGRDMYGIYLPSHQLLDATVFTNMLTNAKNAKLNTVVVDAKDATGAVLFNSRNALAQKAGATADTAYSAQNVAEKISGEGLIPAARIHAFRDSIASIEERSMAVHYYDTDIYWYDNSPDLGGKPWLNPYSKEAQQYIISLAEELCSQGFKLILLDSVQFPSGVGLDKAGYGADAKTITKPEVLSQFVDAISAAVKAKGGELILCLPDDWITTGDAQNDAWVEANNVKLYGGLPVNLLTQRVLLDLPSDTALWADTLRSATTASQNTQWIGMIPAYAPDGTLADCTQLTASLNSAGEEDYILCNPQGNYKLQ